MSRSGEFELIHHFLAPLATTVGAGNLKDDAALIDPPAGRQLVVTTDSMVENVHFLGDGPPSLIARRLLRCNLSDLAAMAAQPEGYLLNLALPEWIDDAWLEGFAAGLAADQEEFGLSLIGGDTVATPGALTLTITAFGSAATPVRRSGAKPGERVFVTGPVGDGCFGLKAVRGAFDVPRLAERYWLPSPRFGRAEGATAATDISDGLVADLGHICRASGVGAVIDLHAVPLSPEVAALGKDARLEALTGGDDYELVLTAPDSMANSTNIPVGRIVPGEGVTVLDAAGHPVPLTRQGYRHD
ncbi:MAG: thiamine-phosphate kinase [Alphaproteobacteria bacterium]|nr:thiamine-phosphate kinase [Alphaproteobacteria bacterium]MCY4318801.1 thiamine-phosphate kinase [Alphaproteobacteria bacterium]